MKRLGVALSLLTLTFLLSGCRPEDGEEPAILPKKVTFEGKVDPRFVGTWTTADGGSRLDLAKDGGLMIVAKSRTPKGLSTSEYVGSWLVSGEKLRLRYREPSGQTTLEYGAKLAGDTLTTQQPGGRLKTTYRRK